MAIVLLIDCYGLIFILKINKYKNNLLFCRKYLVIQNKALYL